MAKTDERQRISDLVEESVARATKRQQLSHLVTEYAELQYPDDDARAAMSERELEQAAHDARSTACQIAELVIEMELHR